GEPALLRATEAVCEAGPQAGAGAAGEGRDGSAADAAAVRLHPGGHAVPEGADHGPTREWRRRLDRCSTLAAWSLALAALRSRAVGAAAGCHRLRACERAPVRGIARRHGGDVPGAVIGPGSPLTRWPRPGS